MKLEFIALSKLSVSKANMRYTKNAPDVSDILPTVRSRGIIQPLIVRPNCASGAFEILGGARRYHAALIVAEETGNAEPLPCAILDEGDDAAAIEASLIENFARLDPDDVTQWETFTRLVKEGRRPEDIAATFGLPDPVIRRILALGNLLPRIRDLYRREKMDRGTVRHLTMASKSQQKAWLALFDDPDAYVPTGHQLKEWLLGGQSIKAEHALFDVETSGLATIADLFGEDCYFTDADAFWSAQNTAIEARRMAYLDAGWSDVVIVPVAEHFHVWEYEKAGKRKGGRVYVDLRAHGEVTFHEGYVSRAEARRAERNEGQGGEKIVRPEVTSAMQTYIDLHRHAAVRAVLTGHGQIALRLMVAHVIGSSQLLRVVPEPQTTRNDAVRESVETSKGEAAFDEHRRAVLGMLGFDPDAPSVIGGNGDGHGVVGLFLRLLDLPDPAVMEIVAVVMGEALAAGSPPVEAVGQNLGIAMADWWQADDAFFMLVRDREVLGRIVAEVAGEPVAGANAAEKAKTLKSIIRDHLDGTDGRTRAELWVPRWMAFPPSAYTARGGVGSVAAHARVEAARRRDDEPDAPASPCADTAEDEDRLAA